MQWRNDKKESAYTFGSFALLALVIALGYYWLAITAPLVAAITFLVRRNFKAAMRWGLTTAASFVVSSFAAALAGGTAATSSTPLATSSPDPYADCLAAGNSKQSCAKKAKDSGYKLTFYDSSLMQSTPQPTDAPTPKPTPEPTQDRHAERVQYQEFWNKTVGNLAMVYVCVNYAAKGAEGGDSVGASRALEYAKNFAESAKSMTTSGIPDAFNNDDIGLQLFGAADKLSNAMDKMRDYIDNEKPSEAVEAQDDAAEATSDVEAATEAARAAYIKMGGKASDLETMQSKVNSTVSALDSLLAGSNQ